MEVWHIWVIAALVLVVVEIFTQGFAVFCLALGAGAAAVASACSAGIEGQLIWFSVVTLVSFVAVRPLLLKVFRKVETYLSGSTCHIKMRWPDTAIAARAIISNGPCKLDDTEAQSLNFTREQYMKDGEIRVPVGAPDKTHISLYAIYMDKQGQKYPSRAVEIDLSSQL